MTGTINYVIVAAFALLFFFTRRCDRHQYEMKWMENRFMGDLVFFENEFFLVFILQEYELNLSSSCCEKNNLNSMGLRWLYKWWLIRTGLFQSEWNWITFDEIRNIPMGSPRQIARLSGISIPAFQYRNHKMDFQLK